MLQKAPRIRLPSADIKRWGARHKAAVVAAVRQGLITAEEAYSRYELSEEEFSSWQRAFENYGLDGLRIGCLQRYRGDRSSPLPEAPSRAPIALRQGSGLPADEESRRSHVPDPV